MLLKGSDFYKTVNQMVMNILREENLLSREWHLGTVDQVISDKKLKVFVDGSDVSQTVSCNPDVTFNEGDHVWVVFINGNARDKFVISRRSV